MRKTLMLALTLIAFGCASTPKQAPVIDHFVTSVLRDVPEVPSLGVAVVKDGRVVYLHDAQTGYYIGSTTKAYSGLACAILAQRGQLDLDAPVSLYLPEVTMANAPTLRSFLTHSSGVENNGIVFRTAFSGEYTPSQLASMLNDSKRTPAAFHYTNLGYVVASLVIERVTGKPWQKVLDDVVFTPLGMTHTTAYMSEAEKWPIATPYQINRKGDAVPAQLRKNDRTMHAAGGIVTTPADLARWLEANMSRSGGGIPAAAFEETQRKQVAAAIQRGDLKSEGYGFGWYEGAYKGERVVFHQGGYTGWQSTFAFLPERKIGVGIMTNASGPSTRALLMMTSQILDLMLEKPTDPAANLADFNAQLSKARTAMLADVEKRAKRPWMLKHPNTSYVGRYENPQFGAIEIASEGDHLVGMLAGLRAPLDAFTEPESVRVEFVPEEGEVLRFVFGAGEKPDSLKWGSDEFHRVD